MLQAPQVRAPPSLCHARKEGLRVTHRLVGDDRRGALLGAAPRGREPGRGRRGARAHLASAKDQTEPVPPAELLYWSGPCQGTGVVGDERFGAPLRSTPSATCPAPSTRLSRNSSPNRSAPAEAPHSARSWSRMPRVVLPDVVRRGAHPSRARHQGAKARGWVPGVARGGTFPYLGDGGSISRAPSQGSRPSPGLLVGPAVADVVDALERRDDLLVVGHDDDRRPDALRHLVQDADHGERPLAVERRRRLVGQDDRRPVDQRPRDGDALLLAARELRAPAPCARWPTSSAPSSSRARSRAAALDAGEHGQERHVVGDVEERDQVGRLEDEADAVAAQRAQVGDSSSPRRRSPRRRAPCGPPWARSRRRGT